MSAPPVQAIRVVGRRRYQPAMEYLREQRWSVRAAAAHIDVERGHLAGALFGTARPNDAVRRRLPELLGVPLEQLFEAQQLALPYSGVRTRAGGSRKK